jgi:transcription antitermination factor NusA-like protein/GTPase SAR1 family protein
MTDNDKAPTENAPDSPAQEAQGQAAAPAAQEAAPAPAVGEAPPEVKEARPEKPEKREKPAPKQTAPRLSAFSGLAKFLTEEQRSKLAEGPEEPTVTVESRESRRGDRDRGPRDRRDRDRGQGRREGGRERREGGREAGRGGERREGFRDRGQERRGGDRDRKGGRDFRGRGPGPAAPRLENVVTAAEKTGQQEAGFGQSLMQALEAELKRFAEALQAIEGLDPKLREVTEAQARVLLDYAKVPLQKTMDGEAPLTIGVVGGSGVGKTTLIEALAGDAKHEVSRDDQGRASTLWRGIRFLESPGEQTVDGLVEIRMADIENAHTGRPLLIIENVRVNLHDGFAFEKFVKDPESFLGAEPVREDFEAVPKVHLPAFNLASQPSYKTRAGRLREISRFSLVETNLARRLQGRAKLLRTQRFIDDLIEAILPLRDFGLTVNLQSHIEAKSWQSRLAEVKAALGKWGDEARASVKANAGQPFASLRGQAEAFANKHAGGRDLDEQWAKRIGGISIEKHVESEMQRIAGSFKETATKLIESSKATRQPGEGPLPQPVLMTAIPQVFRDTTSAFRNQLSAVSDPLHWVSFDAGAPGFTVEAATNLPGERDALLKALNKNIDGLEKKLVDDLTGKVVAAVLAPVDRKLTTESRSLLDALFNLGREGHAMLVVVNEVLLSLVQRLIERAADNHGIKLPLIQKVVREPGHRTKMLVPPSRDLFMLARRLQDALGERVDLIPAVDQPEARIASALLPAKIKTFLIKINEEKRMAQVKVPRTESGKAFGRNGSNQRLAAALTGYHLHLRIAKDKDLQEAEQAAKEAKAKALEEKKEKKAAEAAARAEAAAQNAPEAPAAEKAAVQTEAPQAPETAAPEAAPTGDGAPAPEENKAE